VADTEEEAGVQNIAHPSHAAGKVPPNSQPKVPTGMQSVTLPSGIIISYPSEVAYLFALGKFGAQVAALEEAVGKELKKDDNEPDPVATTE
jgi:hypothetical protein